MILISTPVFADETETNPVMEENNFDITNQLVATKWEQINRNVDMFFTDQSSKDQENKSSVFVYVTTYKTEGQPLKTDYDFQLKFDLPNTTKKLKIVIERQQNEIINALSDTSSPEVGQNVIKNNLLPGTNSTETYYTAGANYLLKQSKYFTSNLRFGIRLAMPLDPSVKLDLNKEINAKFLNILLLQKFLYYRQEGFQNISQIVLNRKLNKNLQIDFLNSLVWTDQSDEFALRHNIILYHDLGDEKGMSYSVGANAKFKPAFYYDSYDTSVSYRQLLHSHWLYGTATIGANFSKSSNFNDEKFVQIRFDIFFKEK